MSPHEPLVFHNSKVSRALRGHLNGHWAINLWFAGLSESGKLMLAQTVEVRLHGMPYVCSSGTMLSVVLGFSGNQFECQ